MIHAPAISFTVNKIQYTVLNTEQTRKLSTLTIAIDDRNSRHVWSEKEFLRMYAKREINN